MPHMPPWGIPHTAGLLNGPSLFPLALRDLSAVLPSPSLLCCLSPEDVPYLHYCFLGSTGIPLGAGVAWKGGEGHPFKIIQRSCGHEHIMIISKKTSHLKAAEIT